MTLRANDRSPKSIRPLSITTRYLPNAEGSALVQLGDTWVLCTASVNEGVPRFLKDKRQGWLTAEYGMLPRSTHTRMDREATRGKASGRTQEIQRLIGRSLRACINLKKIDGYTIIIDCDVLQADGGTRTAAITGGYVALVEAIQTMQYKKKFKNDPLHTAIAAISVGMKSGTPIVDLDFHEDSSADTDMNVVMNKDNGFIEVQGTAEKQAFSPDDLQAMLSLAQTSLQGIFALQEKALSSIGDTVSSNT
jgi:ribonuclease PH